MRIATVLLVLGALPRAQDPPSFDTGYRELADVTPGGWHRRLGPDFMTANPSSSDRRKPTLLYQPPSRPCPFARNNGGMTYEIGGPPAKDAGDFSSTQAQVLYVTEGGGAGLDRILTLDMQNMCFSEKPEQPWWGGFRPEPAVFEWRKKGVSPGGPVGIARGLGVWSNHAIIVFRNGLVATAGTATSQGTHPVFQFPSGKVPTALAVTPRNELALVTVIDTVQRKSQLAVLSLEACAPNFAHDWHGRYPLLANQGSFSDIKLLGYVDLPISFPSAVSGAGASGGGWLHTVSGQNALPRDLDLSKADVRASFVKGSNDGWVSASGYAVVVSRAENKAVFVDLQPLFSTVRQTYFGSPEGWEKTRNLGPKPKQWPFTFDAEPAMQPQVVTTVDVARPVSVLVRATGGEHARAFIGLQEGEIVSFKVGGLATNAAAEPGSVQEAARLKVGKNPVWMASKGSHGWGDYGFIVVSRGDRALQWVKFSKDVGSITRELRDERMIDPVYAEIQDTHGIETQLVSVADFKGRKVINYRCSPVVFATNGGAKYGCGPKGTDEFECGGVMPFPGNPIAVCGTNVN